ncbi:hypothetical protein [Lawsonibacter celer]|jgi:hypothetical protein|nr:hypothetical protein [Lawsonibacter celer]
MGLEPLFAAGVWVRPAEGRNERDKEEILLPKMFLLKLICGEKM